MTTGEKERVFRDAVAEHRDRIYRLCCSYVSDPDQRDDVYQEVLVHVWEGLEKFEGRAQLGTWIYRITVNTCFGFFRAEGRRARVFKRVAAPVEVAARGPAPGDRSLDGLIETMKALDARDLALLRRSMVFFSVAAVFYLGLFVLTFIAPARRPPGVPQGDPGAHRTGVHRHRSQDQDEGP